MNKVGICWNDTLWRLAFAGVVIMGCAVASVAPYRSIVGIERLGLSAMEFAVCTSVSAVATVMASVMIGIFSDQSGRYKDVLMFSLLVGAVGNALLFLFQTKVMFIIAMVVFFPVATTAMSQFFGLAKLAANRNSRIDGDFSAAAIRAAFAGAYAVTPPLWAILILNGTDLLAIFAATAVLNLIMLGVIYARWPDAPEPSVATITTERAGFRVALAELANGSLAVRLVLLMLAGSLTNLNSTVMGLIVLNDLGGTEADIGWFAGSVALCEIPVMLLGASALRVITKPALILIGVTIYGAYLSAYPLLPSVGYLGLLVIPASLGGGLYFAVVIGYVQELVSDKPGTGGALISLVNIGGHVFTALVFGICTVFTGYSETALIGACLAVSAGVALVVLDGGQVRRPDGRFAGRGR